MVDELVAAGGGNAGRVFDWSGHQQLDLNLIRLVTSRYNQKLKNPQNICKFIKYEFKKIKSKIKK